MNICIIGDGLTSLSLAKNLVNKKINVHIYKEKKTSIHKTSRTIGMAKKNLDFFRKEVHNVFEKDAWGIKKIEIFSDKLKEDKILRFKNNNNLFYMLRNDKLYQALNKKLLKNKFFKRKMIKNNHFYKELLKKNKYDLIINCDSNNPLTKTFFSKKIDKDYHSLAYTTVLKHQKLLNDTAIQVFTKFGPIAFLPISSVETSVVCSLSIKNHKFDIKEVLDLINKHNPKFNITKIPKLDSFKLKASNLRNYHYKNILAFGDSLHRIHPLAGQGFNMTIRDIKIFSKIVQNRIDLGMQLDEFVLNEFENKTKHINFIFSNGIDLIYEFFNIERKMQSNFLSKSVKLISNYTRVNKMFTEIADRGVLF